MDESTTATVDHKAFRLCIASDDRHRILDASKWPAYVSVSEWFFKPSTQQRQSGNSTSKQLPQAPIVPNKEDAEMEVTIIYTNTPDNTNNNNNNGI
jgi:hypothetical protein